MHLTTALILTLFAPLALAAGGQNQWNNPNFAEDGCLVSLPAGIDRDTCEAVPADGGLVAYFCADQTVFLLCEDDGPKAPGRGAGTGGR
jgi:hypothetical protein